MKSFRLFLESELKGRKWSYATATGIGTREIVGTLERNGKTYVRISNNDSNQHDLLPADELDREIYRDERNAAYLNKAYDAERQRKTTEDAKQSLDGFEHTLTPTMRGKAIIALTTKGISSNGKFYPCIRDLVRARVADGWTVSSRGLESPHDTFITDQQLGKLGVAYAAYLIKKG